ncbi:MAG: hypothetical protein H7Z16_06375 [Pyrinomonadaceae bacterium]|nr:hypothetical protein [Pyrinomonadaceae bacterium]
MKNDMNEDYLWDQTGKPDPEIQELEQVLGTLGYQPRPLEIPATLQIESRSSSFRSFKSLLAIAATIILAVGAAALWLSFGRQSPEMAKTDTEPAASADSNRAAATVPNDVLGDVPKNVPGDVPNGGLGRVATDRSGNLEPRNWAPGNRLNTPRGKRDNQTQAVERANRRRALEPQMPELAANELKEAEAGKAKLMLALRLASTKLNFALRKAQGNTNTNLIHNQHKIG